MGLVDLPALELAHALCNGPRCHASFIIANLVVLVMDFLWVFCGYSVGGICFQRLASCR
jgi:hypothetical protein